MCRNGRRALSGLLRAYSALARWRTHEVENKSHRYKPINQKRENCTQHTAVAVGGFGDAHHEHDINPGDRDEVHTGFVLRYVRFS